MDTYRSEDEQLDALRQWWQGNGKSIVAGIVVAIALVFGWKAWQGNQETRAAEASALFDQLLAADAAVTRSGQPSNTAETLAETLKSAYSSLSYGQFAALYKAKYAVMRDDYTQATEELRWVLEQAPGAELRGQTELRLAQVLHAQSEYQQALSLLDGLSEGGYAAAASELRGDILLDQGDAQAALVAYQRARAALQEQQSPSNNPLLEMKINDLSAAVSADRGVE